jgi:hypothetical protein
LDRFETWRQTPAGHGIERGQVVLVTGRSETAAVQRVQYGTYRARKTARSVAQILSA